MGFTIPVVYEDKADQTAVLVALGVDQSGHKEVLAIFAGAEESKVAWLSLLGDLKKRGVAQVDLFVTDGGDGLIAALKDSFPSSGRQRCITHKMRNVLGHVPHRKKKEVAAALKGIFAAESRKSALKEKETFEIRYGTVYPAAIRSLQEDFEACLPIMTLPKIAALYSYDECARRAVQ